MLIFADVAWRQCAVQAEGWQARAVLVALQGTQGGIQSADNLSLMCTLHVLY